MHVCRFTSEYGYTATEWCQMWCEVCSVCFGASFKLNYIKIDVPMKN